MKDKDMLGLFVSAQKTRCLIFYNPKTTYMQFSVFWDRQKEYAREPVIPTRLRAYGTENYGKAISTLPCRKPLGMH